MSKCLVTGAVVRFFEWSVEIPCDLHEMEGAIVIRFPAGEFHGHCRRKVTHEVYVGSFGYIDKEAGIAVVPAIAVKDRRTEEDDDYQHTNQ